MRESEEWLLDAEKYSSLAWLDGLPYPGDTLADGWKKVVFNQFHDLAAGSGIGTIYKDAQEEYDQVRLAMEGASANALSRIQASINTRAQITSGSVPVLIFNPLAWQRSGLVETDVQMPAKPATGISVVDAKGRVLPSLILASNEATNSYHLLIRAEDVPSLGYEVVRVVPEGAAL